MYARHIMNSEMPLTNCSWKGRESSVWGQSLSSASADTPDGCYLELQQQLEGLTCKPA